MVLAAYGVVAMLANLRYSARSFARAPGLTLALLLTIALGIGSNVAVLGLVRGSVGRAPSIPGIETMVSLFARDSQDGFGPVSYEGYLSLTAHHDAFDVLGAARELQATVVVRERSTVMSTAAITPELAGLLGLPLDEGVAVSHRVWQIELAKGDVGGEPIRIDGVDMRVASVAPDSLEGLYFGRAVDIWMPSERTRSTGSIATAARSGRLGGCARRVD